MANTWQRRLRNRLLPEGRLKNHLRVFYQNAFRSKSFRVSFNGRYFTHHLSGGLKVKSFDIIWRELQEALDLYVRHSDVHEGDTVIDAGAMWGAFTLQAAIKAGRAGRVIAFEPDPVSFERLERNVRLNDLTNVTLVREGLWNGSGEMAFAARSDMTSTLYHSDGEPLVPVCVCTRPEASRVGDRQH